MPTDDPERERRDRVESLWDRLHPDFDASRWGTENLAYIIQSFALAFSDQETDDLRQHLVAARATLADIAERASLPLSPHCPAQMHDQLMERLRRIVEIARGGQGV